MKPQSSQSIAAFSSVQLSIRCKTVRTCESLHDHFLFGLISEIGEFIGATMKPGTEWNEERNENRMWSVNYHARHAHCSHMVLLFSWSRHFSPNLEQVSCRAVVESPEWPLVVKWSLI